MCGAKSGAKGRLSAPRYTQYGHKEGAEPCTHQTFTREAGDGKPKPVRPPRLPAGRGTLMNGKPVPKKSGKGMGIAVALAFVLLRLLVPAIQWVGDRVQDIGYSNDHSADTYADDTYDQLVTEPLLKGQWHIDRTDGGTLELDVDGDNRYALVIASPEGWTVHESGVATLWEEPQEDGAYDDRYPPEEYDCYSMYRNIDALEFEPDENGAVPESLTQYYHEDGMPVMLLYREIAAPEGDFILFDFTQNGAPLFPSEPERLLRKQAA